MVQSKLIEASRHISMHNGIPLALEAKIETRARRTIGALANKNTSFSNDYNIFVRHETKYT